MMRDGSDETLFARFSRVAQRTGVYTALDYADIVEDLVRHWNIERIPGLSDLAARSQDYLCGLADRYRKLADRVLVPGPDQFSWIFNRQVG